MQNQLHHICKIVESLPHCKKMGLEFTEISIGAGAMRLEPQPNFICNTAKSILHSAVATTLLDTLCGTVATTAYEPPQTVATLDLRIDHLNHLKADLALMARAECFHLNEDVAFVRGWAWQVNETKLVAKATGTFMRNGSFSLQPMETA